jgi:hypothetical protein
VWCCHLSISRAMRDMQLRAKARHTSCTAGEGASCVCACVHIHTNKQMTDSASGVNSDEMLTCCQVYGTTHTFSGRPSRADSSGLSSRGRPIDSKASTAMNAAPVMSVRACETVLGCAVEDEVSNLPWARACLYVCAGGGGGGAVLS